MTLKDFRIGNYYMNDKGAAVLDYWHFDCYKHEEIEPVPLTEEWLLKFGFDCGRKYINGYYYFHIDPKRNKAYINDGDGYEGADILAKIEYVHQLQNLYFALTGEELA